MRAASPSAVVVVLGGSMLLGGAAQALGGAITVNPLATGGFSSMSVPGLTDAGEVVFSGFDDAAGVYGVYSTSGGGVILTLTGSNFLVGPAGAPSVSPGGSVAFLGADEQGDGLYSTSAGGGVIITVRGKDFGKSSLASPSTSDNGTRVFTAVDDATGDTGVYAAPAAGPILTVNGSGFGNSARAPRVSESGMVAFSAIDATGEAGVYASSGGGVLLTIKGQNFGAGITSMDVNGDDEIVFAGVDEFGASGLYRADGGGLTGTIPEWPHASSTVPTIGVGDNGLVVVGLSSLARSGALSSIELTDLGGSFHQTVISVGDSLGGSTVQSLSFSPNGLNNNGQLAFFATLADGSSGLFIATIPAPGVAGVGLIGAGLMAGRRRRSSSTSTRSSPTIGLHTS